MNEQQLDQAINRLTQQIAPQRDLWPELESRLTARSSTDKPPLWQWATAAMLGLVSLIGWQLALLPTAPGGSQANMPTAELMLLQVYEQQKATQLSQVVAVSEGFDNWQQQLTHWDQAIAQVRQALQFYPDEPQLLAQLQSLYQQQLSFIQRATLQQPLIIS
jgi:tetratricopeptide (TPR) repeat protein